MLAVVVMFAVLLFPEKLALNIAMNHTHFEYTGLFKIFEDLV